GADPGAAGDHGQVVVVDARLAGPRPARDRRGGRQVARSAAARGPAEQGTGRRLIRCATAAPHPVTSGGGVGFPKYGLGSPISGSSGSSQSSIFGLTPM